MSSNNNDTAITWKEPPLPDPGNARGRGKWQMLVKELKQNPGRWALAAENTYSTLVTRFKKGEIGDAKPGDIEARGVKTGPGRADVYVRWVGGAK